MTGPRSHSEEVTKLGVWARQFGHESAPWPVHCPASQSLWCAGMCLPWGGLCYLRVRAAAFSAPSYRVPNNLMDWKCRALDVARGIAGAVDMSAGFWAFLCPGCWGEMSILVTVGGSYKNKFHQRKMRKNKGNCEDLGAAQVWGSWSWPAGPSHVPLLLVRRCRPWWGADALSRQRVLLVNLPPVWARCCWCQHQPHGRFKNHMRRWDVKVLCEWSNATEMEVGFKY